MGAIWAFLTNPTNQATLSWLGTGLSALAAATWAVVKFVLNRDAKPGGGAGTVPAQNHVISADGSDRIYPAHGLSGLEVILLALVLVGALVAGAGFLGSHVTAIGGAAIGGNVNHSTINVNGPAESKRP